MAASLVSFSNPASLVSYGLPAISVNKSPVSHLCHSFALLRTASGISGARVLAFSPHSRQTRALELQVVPSFDASRFRPVLQVAFEPDRFKALHDVVCIISYRRRDIKKQ